MASADCDQRRDQRQALLADLDSLEGAVRAAAPAEKASNAVAQIANCLRTSGDEAKGRAKSADRMLQAARLFVAAIAELVDVARRPAGRALMEIEHAQQALVRLNEAVDRLQAVLAVADGDANARLDGLRAFLREARSTLPEMMALPGVAPAVERLDRALEVTLTWSERVSAARARAGEMAQLLPALGLGLPSFGEHDEDEANLARLRRSLAQLDHDLLECGDRPPGPECIDCAKSDVDKAIGRALNDLATKAKHDILERAGASADLVICRTALRELQELDRQIADLRAAQLEAEFGADAAHTTEIDADLEALLERRRELRQVFPAVIFRYRNAAKSFKDAVIAWRDEAGNRLESIAKEQAWSPDGIKHVQSCHPDMDDERLHSLAAASSLAIPGPKKKLLIAIPVAVVLVVLLAVVAGALGGDDSSTPDEALAPGDAPFSSAGSDDEIDLSEVDPCTLVDETTVKALTKESGRFVNQPMSGVGGCFWASTTPGVGGYVEVKAFRQPKGGLHATTFNNARNCTTTAVDGVGEEAEIVNCPAGGANSQSKVQLLAYDRGVIVTLLVNDAPVTEADLAPVVRSIFDELT